ncbi:hypothetical protein EVJ58_g1711 [Rhodofomes roseus]|uniref:Aminoglycoside phosphotransferase domain-containing protein n=1 Tax=Rhodofomes roseus TaxID=34475 RepID=A0A4Y9YZV7_9APHY|nr:hypothetical protein EVJ58_g1711 [Rhodofomes roseus]
MTEINDLATVEGVRAYISGTPFDSVDVSRLSGGLGNFTYRLSLRTPYNGHTTVILKHGKPYVPGMEDMAFSLERQVYEVTALRQIRATLPPAQRKAPSADELATMLLVFPRAENKDVHAVATTSIRYGSDPLGDLSAGPACRVHGDKGEIQIFPPLYRPTKTRLILRDGTIEDREWPQPGPGKGSGWFNGFGDGIQPEGEGQGMFWEADEAAYALVEGRKESPLLTWEESVLIMEVMDEVRKQGGLRFPEKIETTDFPVAL